MSPTKRRQLAELGIATRLATEDRFEMTEAARAANPGTLAYWLERVPPEITDQAEREYRAEWLRKAYFRRLAMKPRRSRQARSS